MSIQRVCQLLSSIKDLKVNLVTLTNLKLDYTVRRHI